VQKKMKKCLMLCLVIVCFCLVTPAWSASGGGLTADGSQSTNVNQINRIHDITGGKTEGSNLFHSFAEFNVETGETANFVGNQNLTNIISRVTGRNDSWIDGKLKTTNTQANLYLLNPNGVMFGSNASLDIQGSFHVTTADYLKFEDENKLSASLGNESVLTSAPVEAFGFLGDDVGSITFDGTPTNGGGPPTNGGNMDEVTALSVNAGKDFSVIGGNLTLKKYEIKAPGGRINLASAQSAGEVKLIDDGMDIGSGQSGDVEFNNLVIRVDNTKDMNTVGQIFVQADDFTLNDSELYAQNVSDTNSPDISIGIEVNNFSAVSSNLTLMAVGKGNAGMIKLNATEKVLFSGGIGSKSQITTAAFSNEDGAGDGGKILIKATDIELTDVAIDSSTFGKGNAGKILLIAKEIITIDETTNELPIISSGVANDTSSGKGGFIGLSAPEIILKGTIIAVTSYNGEITLDDEGRGGSVAIIADSLILADNSGINVSTSGTAKGGSVVIGDTAWIENNLESSEFLTDFLAKAEENGVTETNNILLYDSSSISAGTESSASNAGPGGSLFIQSNDSITLKNNSSFTAESSYAAAGDITVDTKNMFYLLNSEVTTSANAGLGSGGNIKIDPIFVVLNHSNIIAKAKQGYGGNINITTDYLIQSPDSIISASSDLGVDGEININSLEFDVSGSLVNLNINPLDATKWSKTPCRLRSGGSISRLILEGRDAVPTAYDDFLSGFPVILFEPEFFAEDDNPKRRGYLNPELFEEEVTEVVEEECEECEHRFSDN
jgi:filamentous hemagglutinin family protein